MGNGKHAGESRQWRHVLWAERWEIIGNLTLTVAAILVIWGALEAAGVPVGDWISGLF